MVAMRLQNLSRFSPPSPQFKMAKTQGHPSTKLLLPPFSVDGICSRRTWFSSTSREKKLARRKTSAPFPVRKYDQWLKECVISALGGSNVDRQPPPILHSLVPEYDSQFFGKSTGSSASSSAGAPWQPLGTNQSTSLIARRWTPASHSVS